MDADLVATTIQYMIGYAAGCVSGYGFSLKQNKEKMQMHNEILKLHKEQIEKLEIRLKRFEEVIYPHFYDRRKNDGEFPSEFDRRSKGD